MTKEILLYGGIYSYSVEAFINKMEEYKNNDVAIRINSGGGDPIAMWGAASKMREHTKNVLVKTDGRADSAATYLLLYADKSECLNISTFVLHRAAFYNESNLTPSDISELAKVNADMRKALEMKIDEAKLKILKNVTLDDIFNPEQRIDVQLTAEEALEIGLVNKINPINQREMQAISDYLYNGIAASSQEPKEKTQNPTKMDITKLKAEHPELYAQIFALGIAQEKDRVEAFLVYNELDAKGVKAAIEEGKPMTQKQMAEFGLKALSSDALKNLSASSANPVITGAPDSTIVTDKEKELSAFEKEVRANLKLKIV